MELRGAIVAVTGASGFLGSHIACALLDAGASVRAVVRTPARAAWLAARGVEVKQADLVEPDALTTAFRGADVVVSNAALGSGQGELADFERINRAGTENVYRAVARAGVRRAIQISTVAVYQTRLYRRMDESTPLRPTTHRRRDWSDLTTDWRYALTKAQGEALAWSLAEELQIDLTVLRPGPVYGSRDPKLTAHLLERVSRRVVAAPTVGVPLVHAGDVARAVVGAIRNQGSAGNAYTLTGPSESMANVLRTLARVRQTGSRVVSIPIPITVRFDCSAARRDIDFEPRSLLEGLEETLGQS